MLEQVRNKLLDEARNSPDLLSDLAGLEQYIAESYTTRSFTELLQNADDAGAKRFLVESRGNYIFVANDGRQFSGADLESLCRSAASAKHRGTSIGYRGIGFKSIVSFAEKVFLFSDGLELCFSRELTKCEVESAERVPLVRVPHLLPPPDRDACVSAVQGLRNDGYVTIFVFTDLIAPAIAQEFAAFDSTALLFLRSIESLDLIGTESRSLLVSRDGAGDAEEDVTIQGEADATSQWRLMHGGDVSFAFGLRGTEIVRLDDSESLFHAFLPTSEFTEIGCKINGDFSTDPSRTRIVHDDRTNRCIEQAAASALQLIESSLDPPATQSKRALLQAIVPSTDSRLARFKKPNAGQRLVQALLDAGADRFREFRLRPAWFSNGSNFESLLRSAGFRVLPCEWEEVVGLRRLLIALGACEASYREVVDGAAHAELSIVSATDLLNRFAALSATRELGDFSVAWPVWPVDGRVVSLRQLLDRPQSLDADCLDMLRERGSLSELRRVLVEHTTDLDAPQKIVPELKVDHASDTHQSVEPSVAGSLDTASFSKNVSIALTKWRRSEQQVQEYLEGQGWSVRDVSRENVGYDLEATSREGESIFVEVKSIRAIGDGFAMTSNEMSFAREKGSAYVLAVVHATGISVEIAFIRDPARRLDFVRQCRQWVWVCDEYPFEPEHTQRFEQS